MPPGDDGSAVAERAVPLLVFAILGTGFLLLFAGVDWFWMVWVFGFAVVLPTVAILLGEDDEDEDPARGGARESSRHSARDRDRDRDHGLESDRDVADALDTLRDRYARGELSEEQFEAKLEALLETETPEAARERLRRRRAAGEPDRELEPEADADRE